MLEVLKNENTGVFEVYFNKIYLGSVERKGNNVWRANSEMEYPSIDIAVGEIIYYAANSIMSQVISDAMNIIESRAKPYINYTGKRSIKYKF